MHRNTYLTSKMRLWEFDYELRNVRLSIDTLATKEYNGLDADFKEYVMRTKQCGFKEETSFADFGPIQVQCDFKIY